MGGLSHTVSGSIASFRTPSRVPVESLKFHFLPKQAAGTPSPENPIPITGWTGLNGRKAGKNLLQNNIVNGTEYSQGLKFVQNSDGSITITGTATNTSTKLAVIKNYTNGSFPLKAGKYRPHVWSTEVNTYLYMSIIYNDGNSSMYGDAKGSSYGYTLSEDTYVTQVRIGIQAAEGVQFNLTIYPSLEIGSVESTWEDCKGEPIPITFPVAGTNKLDSSSIEIYTKFELVNGVYRNTETDTRTYTQLAVQLWKTKGTYIKTAKTLSVSNTGRQSLTFEVDEPDCKFIVLKHNGIQKDFILIFPRTLGLGTFTISCDVLANDPKTVGGVQLTNIQLEAGDTAHAYVPYSSDNTFYGGYIDPVAGEIVAEYTKKVFNGSETNWAASGDDWNTDNTGFCVPVSDFSHISYWTDRITSNFLKKSDSYTLNKGRFYIANSSWANFRIRMTESMTLQEFKAFLSQNNLEIAYPIATPIHIPIPAEDMKAFLDHNNFWSDANDITEVTYPVTESKDILKARKLIMAGSQPHIEAVSGPVASFNTYMKAPVKELKAYFTPVQEGSGDPSPNNVRPIHGFTEANIIAKGKNLIDKDALTGTDKVWWQGNIVGGYAYHYVTPKIPVKPGASYILTRNSRSQDYVSFFDKNGEYINQVVWSSGTNKTIPDGTYFVGITIGEEYRDDAILQINSGNTNYAPYVEGTPIEVEFPAMKNLVALNYSPYAAQQNPHATIIKQTADELEFTTHGNYTYEYVRLYYIIPAGTYTAKIYATTVDENDNYDPLLSLYVNGERVPFAGIRNGQSATFTLAEDTVVDMRFFGNLDDSSQRTVKFSNFQIERGSAATDYESRAMVYGGYIDAVRGKLVATHGFFKRLYGPSNPSGVLGDYERHGWNTPMVFKSGRDLHDHGYGPGLGRTFCNIAPWDLNYFNDTLHYYIDSTVAYVMLPVGTDANTEIEFCAELATPIEYDITPQVLKTLKGTNNIWADTNGNVDVKYWTH